jgi:hypothetical protein
VTAALSPARLFLFTRCIRPFFVDDVFHIPVSLARTHSVSSFTATRTMFRLKIKSHATITTTA